MSQHARHVMRVCVSPIWLFNLLKTSRPRVISCEGLPPDAKAIRIAHDPVNNCVWAFYEHPSFPLIEDGAYVPECHPTYTEYFGADPVNIMAEIRAKEVENANG